MLSAFLKSKTERKDAIVQMMVFGGSSGTKPYAP